MRTDFKALQRKRDAALKAHGGDPLRASLAHHEDRLRRAVDQRDYSTMRDAERVIADLRARIPAER